jgi:hypothetical protein
LAAKHRRAEPRQLYVVAALGVTTFLLGSKGFSPQFVAWLIPVVLLVWPNKIGLAYVALLSAHTWGYAELVFPDMYRYYKYQEGSFEQVGHVVSLSVVLRTVLTAWIAVHLYTTLARPRAWPRLPVPRWSRSAFYAFRSGREATRAA